MPASPSRTTTPPAASTLTRSPSRRRRRARTSRAARRSPAPRASARPSRLPVCCQWHQNSTVGPAPEIVAPTAPSSSARPDQLHRARIQVRAAVLVQPVGQAAADQREVVVRQPQHQQRRVRHVVHGVGDRHLVRAARLAPRPWAPGPAGSRSRPRVPGGGSNRAGLVPRAHHEPARAARPPRCRDGPPARARGRTAARPARTCGPPRRGPPRSRRRWSPDRPTAGSPSGSGTTGRPPGAAPRRHARTGWSGRSGCPGRPVSTENSPVSSTSSSRPSDSAAASAS